ncbi:MAG: hypothetical protein AAB354_13495 [candidate division KSB1 bacterium]
MSLKISQRPFSVRRKIIMKTSLGIAQTFLYCERYCDDLAILRNAVFITYSFDLSCPSALIGHPSAWNGFPLKDCGNDG